MRFCALVLVTCCVGFSQGLPFPVGIPVSSGGGGATLSKVTSQVCNATTNAASTLTCSPPSNWTSGNAIGLWFANTNSTATFSSIACIGGGTATATLIRGPGTGARNAWVYLVTGCTGTGVQVNETGTIGRLTMGAVEFNRTSGSWAIDAGTCTSNTDCTNNGTGTTSSTAVFTPAAGIPEIIMSITSNGSSASGSSSGWTDETTANAAMQFSWRIETSTTGTYSRNWTIAVSNTWNTAIGGIK